MMNYILFAIFISTGNGAHAQSALSHEYDSKAACEAGIAQMRKEIKGQWDGAGHAVIWCSRKSDTENELGR